MRTAIRIGLLASLAGSWTIAAPVLKTPPKKDPQIIVGEWVSEDEGEAGMRHIFTAEGEYYRDRGKAGRELIRYAVNDKKDPAEIDLHPGKKFAMLGIFKVEGDTLTLRIGRMGEERPTKFEKLPDRSVWLATYKRVKPKD